MTAANTAVQLELDSPEERNRVTVAFRGLLLIPQAIVNFALSIAAAFALFLGWFAALATGRLPNWVRTYVAHLTAYQARVSAYQFLLVDQYPPFAFTSPAVRAYPVQLDLPEPGRLSRAKVLFRFILAIPVSFVILALNYGWVVCGFFVWLSVLITGRTPKPAFDAISAMLRYLTRLNAWLGMLTEQYPRELFGDKYPEVVEQRSATRPLVLSRGGRRLLIAMIVLGALSYVAYTVTNDIMIIQQMQHMPHR